MDVMQLKVQLNDNLKLNLTSFTLKMNLRYCRDFIFFLGIVDVAILGLIFIVLLLLDIV